MQLGRIVASIGTTVVVGCAIAFSQRITWLGSLQPGFGSVAWGVAADGRTVVGVSGFAGQRRAFLWREGVGMQALPVFDGAVGSEAWNVSDDGRYVVGTILNSNWQYQNIRWDTQTGTFQNLGTFGGAEGRAFGISADGSVVVGYAFGSGGAYFAYRWTQGGGLVSSGAPYSWAYGVSADGQTVVGLHYNPGVRAFRWRGDSFQEIGIGVAYATNANGSVVVGITFNAANQQKAFVWREGQPMQVLPDFGNVAVANDVSDDGSVIVGEATLPGVGRRAVRWTSAGIEDLNTTYAHLLADGSTLFTATRISATGRFIVGFGRHNNLDQAYLLDTRACASANGDVDQNGCVNNADLLSVLFAFGQAGSSLPEDVNCDGQVNNADLLTILFNFGGGC
ncbi:MAG: hypothetical protein RMJ83_04660 [Armatimonadota bacterium]|nr:hypothetical protein [Armatimonadota bacterium]